MSNKVSKARVAKAVCAMAALGISEAKVKPVLKKLLKLFDRNWVLIETEDYRALADAIFEEDEIEEARSPEKINSNEEVGPSMKIVNGEEEEMEEEPGELERPLKRLRHRYRDGQISSVHMPNTRATRVPLIRPKEEPDELPENLLPKPSGSQHIGEPAEPMAENASVKSQAATSQSLGKSKGKQLIAHERADTCQPNGISRSQQNSMLRSESRSPSHAMRLRERGNKPVSPQIPSKERRPVPESSSSDICLKEPKAEPGTVVLPEQTTAGTPVLIKPKDEPITDDMTILEPPITVIHTDPLNGGDPSCRNDTSGDHGPEPSNSQSMSRLETTDGTASPNEPRNKGKLPLPSDASGARGLRTRSMNQSVDSQSNGKVPLLILSTSHSHCEGIDDGSQPNEMAAGDGTGSEKRKNCTEQTNKSSVVVEQCQVTPRTIGSLHDGVDIAKGQEQVVITLVNEVNDEGPPSFFYIPKNAIFQNAYVNFSLARIGDDNSCSTCVGDCLSLDTPCACSYETGGEFAYTTDGLIKEDFLKESISMNRDPKKHCQFYCKECPLERSKGEGTVEPCKGHLVRRFIKECWLKCGCNKFCGNRVVQRGISRNLQVFMSPGGKGWGLRTLEDLPKGAFVCEYVGEVLTNAELFERVLQSPEGEKHSYPVLLDADWCAEGVLKDEDALCLDATYYGNVARFINHRCYDSNMVEIPVEVETPDHHYYHLAFFTTRKVKAMEELTWDYGIDFDDLDHPIKAFRCQCGSKFCRNIKRFRRGVRR